MPAYHEPPMDTVPAPVEHGISKLDHTGPAKKQRSKATVKQRKSETNLIKGSNNSLYRSGSLPQLSNTPNAKISNRK